MQSLMASQPFFLKKQTKKNNFFVVQHLKLVEDSSNFAQFIMGEIQMCSSQS